MTPEEALKKAIEACGTAAELARRINLTPQAISQWGRIPAERLGEVSRATKIPPRDLRPDLFEKQVGAA